MPVVVFVACLPVLVLGAGAALHHLLGDPTAPVAEATHAAPAETAAGSPEVVEGEVLAEPDPEPARRAPGRRGQGRGRRPVPRRLLGDYLTEARAQLGADIDPSPAWCRQVTGCSRGTSVKLAAALRAEHDRPPARLTTTASGTSSDREEFAA